MKVQDVFRAQYFLACLEKEIKRTEKSLSHLSCFSISLHDLLVHFSSYLLIELDQLLLPTVVDEIHKAKHLGLLQGKDPEERYTNFFVNDKGYTAHAKDLVTKYPFLFELVDNLIRQTFDALILCLTRFWEDRHDIRQWLQKLPELMITQVQPLSSSDRHRKQQSILICFSCEKKLIYKPVDLLPDLLFREFLGFLDLDKPYDLRTLNVLPKGEYGWMKYIHQKACNTLVEVKNFYCRTGVLLAVTDALNYTDGHCENLIADGEFPILIDNETFFQNYEKTVAKQKNILSTLLIQKVTEDSIHLNSALQAPSGIKLEHLRTHPINDHTDEIEVRYFGINPSEHHHNPVFENRPQHASDYFQHVIEGYSYAYDRITCKVMDIIKNANWWERVSKSQSRIVIRETMSYVYLLRKIQQPENMTRTSSEKVLREKLGITAYTDYEVSDLLSLNIPYFYHLSGERHLYNGNGCRYENTFSETAIEVIKQQLMSRSEEKKFFDCNIIARHLTATQIPHNR